MEKERGIFLRDNKDKPMFSLIDFSQWWFEVNSDLSKIDYRILLKDLINNLNWFRHTRETNTVFEILVNIKKLSYALSISYGFGNDEDEYWNLEPFIPLAYVLEHGMTKYKLDNWKNESDDILHCVDSAMRHILALQKGNEIDKDSGQHHVGHIMANVMFLSYHL